MDNGPEHRAAAVSRRRADLSYPPRGPREKIKPQLKRIQKSSSCSEMMRVPQARSRTTKSSSRPREHKHISSSAFVIQSVKFARVYPPPASPSPA